MPKAMHWHTFKVGHRTPSLKTVKYHDLFDLIQSMHAWPRQFHGRSGPMEDDCTQDSVQQLCTGSNSERRCQWLTAYSL